ncbi:hypothetical protein, conserved [Angomonas deanei]|uniref:Uncharacterized protein n=1 Tax=Angomonas deanei TaxID=59799 RepID=A0A7G2CBH9_9TRYP|nr:hypothetical protein, conserved [Angomonas deanei]
MFKYLSSWWQSTRRNGAAAHEGGTEEEFPKYDRRKMAQAFNDPTVPSVATYEITEMDEAAAANYFLQKTKIGAANERHQGPNDNRAEKAVDTAAVREDTDDFSRVFRKKMANEFMEFKKERIASVEITEMSEDAAANYCSYTTEGHTSTGGGSHPSPDDSETLETNDAHMDGDEGFSPYQRCPPSGYHNPADRRMVTFEITQLNFSPR